MTEERSIECAVCGEMITFIITRPSNQMSEKDKIAFDEFWIETTEQHGVICHNCERNNGPN